MEYTKEIQSIKNIVSDLEKFSIGRDGVASEAFDRMMINYSRVYDFTQQRRAIVYEHCQEMKENHSLSVKKHEEYHKNGKLLLSAIDDFFEALKTFMNRFVVLCYKSLPHGLQKGLKSKGVSSFLNTLSKASENLETKKNVAKDFRRISKKLSQIQKFALEYRDKSIEHLSENGWNESRFIRLSEDGPHVEHVNSIAKNGKVKKGEETKFLCIAEEIHLDGSDFLLHLKPHSNVKTGDTVKAGDLLYVVAELKNGHFNKYGPHIHYYPRANTSEGEIYQRVEKNIPYLSNKEAPFLPEISELIQKNITSISKIIMKNSRKK